MLRTVILATTALTACIEVSQSTAVPDAAADAVEPSDAASDAADSDETPSCGVGNPCPQSGDPCRPVSCVEGRCITTQASGVPCALDDLCRIGVCQEGQCLSAPLSCPSDDPCRTPVCDPRIGCDTLPVTDGFCEATPAFPWGQCVGPLMTPPDMCNSDGRCIDLPVGGPRAPAFPNLVGPWLALTFEAHGSGRTARFGALDLTLAGDNATARWQPSLDSTLIDPGLLPGPVDGGWCMDAENGFSINLPAVGAFVGQVARTGDVLAAMRLNGNELMVGVRPGPTGRPPDGAYRMLLSHADAYGEMDTWVGAVRFDNGCLVGAPVIRHSVEVRDFSLERVACFAVEDTLRAGPTQAARFQWRDDATRSRPFELVGGLTEAGDIGIFALRDGEGRAERGLALLVRESPFRPDENATLFASAIERRPTGLSSFVHGGLRCMATIREARLVNGHVERVQAGAVGSDWSFSAANLLDGDLEWRLRDGGVVMRPRYDERRRHWAGIVSERARLGFVYEVAPATTIGDTAVPRPLWPFLGVVIQRN